MPNVDDRAPPQQTVVSRGLADVGAAFPRRLIAHLITDRIAEILSDRELVGRLPSSRRRYLHRTIVMVANPRPLDSHLADGRLEGVGTCPPPLDASAPFAVPLVEDQFFVGFPSGLGTAFAG
jgi:hypothetical protein